MKAGTGSAIKVYFLMDMQTNTLSSAQWGVFSIVFTVFSL